MEGPTVGQTTESQVYDRAAEPGPPETEYESKMVMLRAERHDRIQVLDVVTRLQHGVKIPSKLRVVKRSTPYFGPKLILSDDHQQFQLTAPGPDSQLLLWRAHDVGSGERYGWEKIAEVTVQFADDQPQYDLCPECGQPMQTIEHQRKAAVNRCPGPEA